MHPSGCFFIWVMKENISFCQSEWEKGRGYRGYSFKTITEKYRKNK